MGTTRDIALVFLSLEALMLGVVPFVFLVALAYGVHRLRGWAVHTLQDLTARLILIQTKIEALSIKIVEPFITVRSRWHQVAAMGNYLTRRLTFIRR